MFIQFSKHQDLALEFKTESNTVWYFQFDDPVYIECCIQKAWLYTQKKPDKTPADRHGWKRLITFILENDFKKHKQQLKSKSRADQKSQNRYAYEPLPMPKECAFCDGLGYVWVYSLDHSHDTLMRCDCIDPLDNSYEQEIPQWSPHLASIYRKDKCPVEWFMPDQQPPATDRFGEFMSTPVNAKIYHWVNRRRMAKEFWMDKKVEIQKEIEAITSEDEDLQA